MASTSSPTVQKELQISFCLDDGDGNISRLTLPIKPEDLTRQEPFRVSAVATLGGGAWVDSFGRGLTTLTISGNTGWRDRSGAGDGVKQFTTLRDKFIHEWSRLRTEKIAAGKDPSAVRLIFIDQVNNNYVADVVSANFTLRRSKNNPLLLMYNIVMTVTNDKAVAPSADATESAWYPSGTAAFGNSTSLSLSSIDGSIASLKKLQTSIQGKITAIGDVGTAARKWTSDTFMPAISLAREVINTANMTKQAISEAGQIAVNFATDLSKVGVYIWGAVAAVATIPASAMSDLMRIKGEFSNLRCVLTNGFADAMWSYDYSDLYGASNCSSTSGGRPASVFAGTNPFDTNVALPSFGVSSAAASSIQTCKSTDILNPISASQTAYHCDVMRSGVSWR